jgi:hypothetical protein
MFDTVWCVVLVVPGSGLRVVSRHVTRPYAVLMSAPYGRARVMHERDVREIQAIYLRSKLHEARQYSPR